MKLNIILFLICIFSIIEEFISKCVQGGNCPNKRGICENNQCICSDEFYSLNYQLYKSDKIFCEYKRMSRLGPLILEFFLPTIGHLYARKKKLFISKLIIILFPILCYCCGLTKIGASPDGIQRNISNFTWILLILFIVSIIILPFFHIIDLTCYTFGLYYDGNGVPFI